MYARVCLRCVWVSVCVCVVCACLFAYLSRLQFLFCFSLLSQRIKNNVKLQQTCTVSFSALLFFRVVLSVFAVWVMERMQMLFRILLHGFNSLSAVPPLPHQPTLKSVVILSVSLFWCLKATFAITKLVNACANMIFELPLARCKCVGRRARERL